MNTDCVKTKYKWDIWFQKCGDKSAIKHEVTAIDDAHALQLIRDAMQKDLCCVALERAIIA